NRRHCSRDYYWSCGLRPALLRTTAAGLRGPGAFLLLDARTASVGWVQGSVDLSRGPSLRVSRPVSFSFLSRALGSAMRVRKPRPPKWDARRRDELEPGSSS